MVGNFLVIYAIRVLATFLLFKEAEDLLKVAENHHLPENRNIITKIIIEMQKLTVFDETNKFKQQLRQLQN